MYCLDPESLQRFVHGDLEADERTSVDNHLANCERCITALAQLARGQSKADVPGVVRIPNRTKDPWIGVLLDGRYKLTQKLGQGSMGTVYAALDERLQVRVALKMLNAQVLSHPNAIHRLELEGKICASLGHPGIVHVIRTSLSNEPPYLVMELLTGQTLAESMSDGPKAPHEAAAIITQLASALSAVHEHGVIHRDIKPSNIFITTDGRVKLLDFGICHLMQASHAVTMSHHFIGTPLYAAPELFESAKNTSIASDIYALGCVLYELLYGRALFASDSLASLLRQKQHTELSHVKDSVLGSVLMQMLARRPQDRFSSANQLVRALATEQQRAPTTPSKHASSIPETPTAMAEFAVHEAKANELVSAGQDLAAAGHYALAALSAARASLAPDVLRLSEKALGIASRDQSQDYELYVARGQALRTLGRFRDQLQDLELAKSQTISPWQRARLEIDHAFALLALGETHLALGRLRNNDGLARESESPHVLALHLGTLAVVLAYASELDEAEGPLAEAEALVQSQVPSLRPNASIWRAQVSGARGDLWARHQAYKRAIQQYEEVGDMRNATGAAANLADIYNSLGMYDESRAALTKVIEQCVAMGNTLIEGYARCNLGYALIRLQQRNDAAAELQLAEALAERSGDHRLARHVQLYRAEGHLQDREFQEAIAIAQYLGTESDEVGAHAAALELACSHHLAPQSQLGKAQSALLSAVAWWQAHDEMEEREGLFLLRLRDGLQQAGRATEAQDLSLRASKRLRSRVARIGDASWRARFSSLEGHIEFLSSNDKGTAPQC